MATPVKLPELGESVTEGTVTRWLKQVGESVEVDEPLLEVSTDKVDTEIPSPVAGTLLEIRVEEDETVEVGAELAIVGSSDEAGSAADSDAPDTETSATEAQDTEGAEVEGADAEAPDTGAEGTPTVEDTSDAADEEAADPEPADEARVRLPVRQRQRLRMGTAIAAARPATTTVPPQRRRSRRWPTPGPPTTAVRR
jgi:2-oxoglutarate dehydrogenase E2 component (dihydrolipoamide succinyltransferase)